MVKRIITGKNKLLFINKNTAKIFFAFISLLSINFLIPFSRPVNVDAQSSSSVWTQINSLEEQMSQLNSKISSEQSQVNNLNGKIQNNSNTVSQLQTIIAQKEQLISDKQSQINLLNQSISDEKSQINDLSTKINSLYSIFVQRAKASYENSYVNPLLITIGNKSIVGVFANLEYFTTTRNEDSQVLSEMKNSQEILQQKLDDLNVQQTDLTNAQTELVAQKSDLQNQQNQLQSQIYAYNAQNSQIKASLSTDQAKYASIVSQINSLQIGTFTGGSGCITGGAWWYYNQQCYGRLPGLYGTSIDMVYGCLITDIAMVATRETGNSLYNPVYVASRTVFSGNYMAQWPQIPLSPSYVGYHNLSAINSEIAQGLPVIVYLSAPYGEHWVVFYQNLGGGNYMIMDPWYGPNLRFLGSSGHEYYSDSEIGDSYILQ